MATITPDRVAPCTHSELAVFLNSLADSADQAYKARLRQAANHFDELAKHPVQPMLLEQREEIQRLCQHPLLSRADKTMTLLAHVRYDKEQAAECIRQLQSKTSTLDDMRQAA